MNENNFNKSYDTSTTSATSITGTDYCPSNYC